jgi:hypothetical protein
MKVYRIIVISMLALLLSHPSFAMTNEEERRFKIITNMSLEELGQTASKILNVDYPDTDWATYNSPNYVYVDLATEMAYKVAVKNSRLLGIVNVSDDGIVIPCYCTCDSFGHDNLLYCFYKNGDLKDGFDNHGAQCAVCVRQALLAFLWNDLGASHDEIMKGMKEKFATLIEKYHQHEH